MRTNQQWLDELSGKKGKASQQNALSDLGECLYNKAYFRLQKIHKSRAVLRNLDATELTDFAKDFSQDAVEKIAHNQFALLNKYKQKGSFVAWATKITMRIIANELRRPYWERRNFMNTKGEKQQTEERRSPETMALIEEVHLALQECIQRLKERNRIIFIRCIMENEPAEALAKEFQTTANAIHILNYRSREKLSNCMKKKGFDENTLNLF